MKLIRLKEARLQKKLTQKQIAEMLNINRVVYNRYENGKNIPNLKTAKKIAEILEISLDYLVGRQ